MALLDIFSIVLVALSLMSKFINFEKSISNVKGLSGASAEDMKELTAKAREMGRVLNLSSN